MSDILLKKVVHRMKILTLLRFFRRHREPGVILKSVPPNISVPRVQISVRGQFS